MKSPLKPSNWRCTVNFETSDDLRPSSMPDRHWLLSPRVWIRTYQPILGDPGGDGGGEGKSKRAENRPFRLSLAPNISPRGLRGWSYSQTADFAVTGGNEAGVDLVLIPPFLLYYVNYVVLIMLTCYFLSKIYIRKERMFLSKQG